MSCRICLLCGGLLLAVAADPAEPPGAAKTMDELLAWFTASDLNGDNYLDKAELAAAFRGDDPKAAVDKPAAKDADESDHPDHDFLVRLDQDGDGRISRDEFVSWAKEYAAQVQQQAEQDAKVAQLQAQTATASSKELKALERELKKEQAAAKKLNAQMTKEMKALEKALRQHRKKHK